MAVRSAGRADVTVDATRHQPQAGEHEAGAAARLHAVFPTDLRLSLDLGPDAVVLGRAPESPTAPAILHPTVSRQHFAITWDSRLGAHLGRDLGSRNGSWVDGQPAKDGWHVLRDGAIVRVGGLVFAYERGHTFDVPAAPEVSAKAIPGEAMSVLRLRSQLARAAPDVSPALIIGETGTGKESIARELHRLSGRKGDFVAVNCATFGEQLIESQLFGHVKGAFTGATTDQEGLFVAAQGGTLFLDEIGEMPLELQPKLLRAIQEREIRAVGSTRNVKVDVRIVAATHRDLVERARLGTFRQDLYARLALWQLQVPALRERRADVVRWARFLHAVWCEERKLSSDPGLDLHPDAAEALALLAWPENLRGMNRLVHEVAVLRLREPLRREHLPDWVRREHAAILREERA
jgi:hypothetical protein